MSTKPSNMRLDDETNELIDSLSKHIGSTRTGAVKYAVRETVRQLRLRRKKMALQQSIETSEYSTATAEYNGMYTTVDGSLLDGNYIITTGVQGMPPRERQEVFGIDAAINAIKDKGLLDEDWEPVGEGD